MLFLAAQLPVYAQKTSGKKLRTTERAKSSNPAKWDWGKIMWFRAKKRDHKTKEYNPDRRPKRQTYDNKPNYQSESRKPGDSDVELKRPLIPFDSRIADEGPVLIKKPRRKKPNGKDVGPQIDIPFISPINPDETLNKKKKDKKDRQVDGKKLYTVNEKEKPKGVDDGKLMTVNRAEKRKPFDDGKLMTVERKDRPKPFDESKLMYYTKSDPKKQDLSDDRLMVTIPKINRSKLHDERLLTVNEKHYPTATMKRISADIAKYEGDYKITVKKGKDYHPSSRHLAAKRHGSPFIAKTQQNLSMFWSKIWPWDLQPTYVTDKKPKVKRDRKEGQIWDNTVHPNTWNTKPEQAESGEEK